MIDDHRVLTVVLPALNEEASLTRLIPNLVKAIQTLTPSFHIVVVDDGSTDATGSLLAAYSKEWNVRVIRHEINRGYGASLASGFRWAVEQNSDLIFCMDSDNTHAPTYIPALAQKLDQGFDVVTASYVRPESHAYGVPASRRVLSAVVNMLFHLTFPVSSVRTYTNGYRVYRTSALRRVFDRFTPQAIQETGFAGGTEFFLKVCATGGRASEIPFDFHYEERGDQSKINIRRTTLGYLRLLRQALALKRLKGTP